MTTEVRANEVALKETDQNYVTSLKRGKNHRKKREHKTDKQKTKIIVTPSQSTEKIDAKVEVKKPDQTELFNQFKSIFPAVSSSFENNEIVAQDITPKLLLNALLKKVEAEKKEEEETKEADTPAEKLTDSGLKEASENTVKEIEESSDEEVLEIEAEEKINELSGQTGKALTKVINLAQQIGELDSDMKALDRDMKALKRKGREEVIENLQAFTKKLAGVIKDINDHKELFDQTINAIQEKLHRGVRYSQSVPDTNLITVSKVLKEISKDEIVKGISEKKEKYLTRSASLEDLITRLNQLTSQMHDFTDQSLAMAIELLSPSEFIAVKERLEGIESINLILESITVSTLRKDTIETLLEKATIRIKNFEDNAAASRRKDREAAKATPTEKEVLTATYDAYKNLFITITAQTAIICKSAEQEIAIMQESVDAWKKVPDLTEDSFKKFAMLQSVTAEQLQTEFKAFSDEHESQEATLAKMKSDYEKLKNHYTTAQKEVNRMYDVIQRKGVHITETRYDRIGGHVDKDVKLPWEIDTTTKS